MTVAKESPQDHLFILDHDSEEGRYLTFELAGVSASTSLDMTSSSQKLRFFQRSA